jgi:hypothetical protein
MLPRESHCAGEFWGDVDNPDSFCCKSFRKIREFKKRRIAMNAIETGKFSSQHRNVALAEWTESTTNPRKTSLEELAQGIRNHECALAARGAFFKTLRFHPLQEATESSEKRKVFARLLSGQRPNGARICRAM